MNTTLWNAPGANNVPVSAVARAVAGRLVLWSGAAAVVVVTNMALLFALLWAVSIIE